MLTFLHYRLLVKHALVSCIFLRHAMPFFSFAIEHQQSAYSDTRCTTSRQPSICHANTLFHSTQLLLLPRYPMCHLKTTQYPSCQHFVPQHATAVATAVRASAVCKQIVYSTVSPILNQLLFSVKVSVFITLS